MRKLTIALTFLVALALSVSAQAAYQSIGAGPGVLWGSERVKINENFVELYAWHWDAEETYETGEFVFYGQKVWKAVQGSTGVTPTEGATWTSQLGTVTGGTGNVTVSGAPVAGYVATWASGTAIQGVALPTFVTSLSGQSWNFTAGFDARNATSVNFGPLVLAAGDTSPVTSGELRYDTVVTGMSAGALAYMNSDSEVRYIVDIPTLPTTDSILRYNPNTDEYGFVANTSSATNVSVTDTGGYFGGNEVETVLQEVGAGISDIEDEIASITVGSPLTTAPTYSDDECTAGEYAFDATYVYFCTSTDTWDRIALAGWNNPTPTYPILSSAVIGAPGTSVTLGFSEAITTGVGGAAGWDITCSEAGTVSMTYSSGSGTTSYVYTLGSTVNSGDTCTADYVQPGDGLEDGDGDDLASITDAVVTNNSTQGGSGGGDLLSEHFTGTGTQETWTTMTQEGGTYNPDDTTYAGTHAGFVGDHLTVSDIDTFEAIAGIDLGQTVSSVYFRFYMRVNSEGFGDGNSEKILAIVGDGAVYGSATYIGIILYKTSGQLYVGLDYNGSANVSVGSTSLAISTETVYKVEGHLVSDGNNDSVEWKVNGTSIGSRTGSFITANEMRDVYFGRTYGPGMSLSLDTLDIDSTNYPDL